MSIYNLLFQKFASTMRNEWGQFHLYEKYLKSDLRLLEKQRQRRKANAKKEIEQGVGSKIMNRLDEQKIHAVQKKIASFKNLLFKFYN